MAIGSRFASIYRILAVCVGLGFVSACTSAPIDMRGALNEQVSVAEQTEVRRAAADLAELVEARGWSVSESAAQSAQSFFGRLIGGAGGEPEAVANPVADYLAASDQAGLVLVQDVAQLADQADGLARTALAVAGADVFLPAESLSLDIAASEQGLGAVRRATAFFRAARDDAELDIGAIEQVNAELDRLRQAERALAAAADALAERRWATRSGLFG